MIRKRGNKYILYNRSGTRILGRHRSRTSALRQERAIWASKRRRGK